MIAIVLLLIYLFGMPWLVLRLAKRWRWIDLVSPMAVLYVVGLIVGNIGVIDADLSSVCENVSNVMVPLALPLLLFGCNLKQWSTPLVVKALVSGLGSVLVMIVAGFFLLKGGDNGLSSEEMAQVSGVAVGIYTGGIPNIGAIAKGVGLSNELYLLVTSYDLIATGLYLVLVMMVGKWLFRKLLPNTNTQEVVVDMQKVTYDDGWKKKGLLIGLAIGVAALACGFTFLVCGDLNIALLILVITTVSLLLAQWKPVREQDCSFNMGVYLVLVFCLAIATMVNVKDLHLLEHINVLWYIVMVIMGSLVLQVIIAKLWKIDGDTVLVTSVALINSPPFVPMVAAMLGNRQVVMTGISIGLLGYAMGNYLGIGIWKLLLLIGA